MKCYLKNVPINRRSIDTRAISINLFVIIAFCTQLFVHILKSNSLLIATLFVLAISTILLNANQTKTYLPIIFVWLGVLIIIVISSFRTIYWLDKFSINEYVHMFVFFAGSMLLIFSGNDDEPYRSSFRLILLFSIFYAVSIWIQIFLPSLYSVYLNLLLIRRQTVILSLARSGLYYTGFTINPGYTAVYIASGIILLSNNKSTVKNNIIRVTLLLFLSASLLMTGRRAHTLFLMLALLGTYLLPYKGQPLLKKVRKIAIFVLVLLFVIILLKDLLIQIPFFLRISSTIDTAIVGGDISSGRTPLYDHAWDLFLSNPWFGIGWSKFRHTTIGNITITKELEVHNTYLQLLCETGIFSFIIIMLAVIAMFVISLKSIRQLSNENTGVWFVLLNFSLGYQMYFLLLGLTESVFYDPGLLMLYCFSCAIALSFIREQKQKKNVHFEKIRYKHKKYY